MQRKTYVRWSTVRENEKLCIFAFTFLILNICWLRLAYVRIFFSFRLGPPSPAAPRSHALVSKLKYIMSMCLSLLLLIPTPSSRSCDGAVVETEIAFFIECSLKCLWSIHSSICSFILLFECAGRTLCSQIRVRSVFCSPLCSPSLSLPLHILFSHQFVCDFGIVPIIKSHTYYIYT